MLLIACLLCLIKYLIDSLRHPVVLALVGHRPIPFVPYISYGVLIVLFIVNT
ncbi:Type IV leader peptidase family protein (fragment) [Latilactobacillus curvatus]